MREGNALNGVTLNFANQEEYNKFIDQLKKDILTDIKPTPAYSAGWIAVREDLEKRLRGEFNFGCGQWYQNQNGLYAAFRLAFQKDTIKDLRHIEDSKIQEFYDELIGLIEKWRAK